MVTLGSATITASNVIYGIDLDITSENDLIEVDYRIGIGNNEQFNGKITFTPNGPDNSLSTSMAPIFHQQAPLALCLAGCVAKGLIGPLIECLRGNWNNFHKVVDCMKKKGLPIAAEVAICAYECHVNHP
jgi:hypothetical protein